MFICAHTKACQSHGDLTSEDACSLLHCEKAASPSPQAARLHAVSPASQYIPLTLAEQCNRVTPCPSQSCPILTFGLVYFAAQKRTTSCHRRISLSSAQWMCCVKTDNSWEKQNICDLSPGFGTHTQGRCMGYGVLWKKCHFGTLHVNDASRNPHLYPELQQNVLHAQVLICLTCTITCVNEWYINPS